MADFSCSNFTPITTKYGKCSLGFFGGSPMVSTCMQRCTWWRAKDEVPKHGCGGCGGGNAAKDVKGAKTAEEAERALSEA